MIYRHTFKQTSQYINKYNFKRRKESKGLEKKKSPGSTYGGSSVSCPPGRSCMAVWAYKVLVSWLPPSQVSRWRGNRELDFSFYLQQKSNCLSRFLKALALSFALRHRSEDLIAMCWCLLQSLHPSSCLLTVPPHLPWSSSHSSSAPILLPIPRPLPMLFPCLECPSPGPILAKFSALGPS